jgi:hypothetical protein
MLFAHLGRRLLRNGLPLVAITWVGIRPSTTRATTLWYNGDFDLNDAATNENNVPINIGGTTELEQSLVFNNFTVPAGQKWTISSVFSNDQIAYFDTISTATWQIRSGMSSGNGARWWRAATPQQRLPKRKRPTETITSIRSFDSPQS